MTYRHPEWEGEYTSSDMRAWRYGDWIIVELAGKVRYRRLTRDPAFVTARARFNSNRSPRVARKEETLIGFEIRVQKPMLGDDHYNNFIDVPVEAAGTDSKGESK